MKGFAICQIGFERFLEKELAKSFSNVKKNKGYCIFDFDEYEKIIGFIYSSPLIVRAGELILEGKINPKLKDNNINFENSLFSFFNENLSFRVECERVGDHEFRSVDIEKFLGGFIHDEVKKRFGYLPKVDLKNPDLNIYSLIVDESMVLGVDLVGFDSNKRDYKIFNNSHSIKGDLGHVMCKIGLKDLKSGIILDPFCSDGVLSIELGFLLNNRSHNFYRKKDFLFRRLKRFENIDHKEVFKKIDEEEITNISFEIYAYDPMMPNIKATQKNAKIAGIEKAIKISKISTDMLELKFDENSVSRIITVLPSKSKLLSEDKIRKYYDTFFDQAAFILKKDAKIVLVSDKIDFLEFSDEYGFKNIETVNLFENNRKIYVLKK
ncbi:hypothetical protein C0585_07365 [Candidatus Woesearchaeota archaeon]|nr:MAG: hypothetical protein C0585_07365 [Candidatus Woesearchaeota archaeon]